MTYAATAPTTAFLPREDLDRLLDALRADGRTVVGPTVRDGAVVYDEIASVDALPVGWRSDVAPGTYRLRRDDGARAFDYGVPVTSWKRYTHPPRVPLTRTSDGRIEAIEPEAPALAFIGVRACEIAALDIQERVLRAGPAGDVDHARRRDEALVVAVECALASSTCFCTSMGTGPEVTGGADLVLSELDDGFTVRALSEAGRDGPVSAGPARRVRRPDRGRRRAGRGRAVRHRRSRAERRSARNVCAQRPNTPAGTWSPSAASLARTAPSFVLPASARACRWRRTSMGSIGESERTWDSCFTLGFGRVAGDNNFRPARGRPVSAVVDAQVLDLVGPVRLHRLRRLWQVHHVVPRRHRRPRGAARDRAP